MVASRLSKGLWGTFLLTEEGEGFRNGVELVVQQVSQVGQELLIKGRGGKKLTFPLYA